MVQTPLGVHQLHFNLAGLAGFFTKELVIRLPYGEDDETLGKIDRLRAILPNYRGSCPVWLVVRDGAGRLARLKLAADYWVNPATLQMEELDRFLGPGAAVFNGR